MERRAQVNAWWMQVNAWWAHDECKWVHDERKVSAQWTQGERTMNAWWVHDERKWMHDERKGERMINAIGERTMNTSERMVSASKNGNLKWNVSGTVLMTKTRCVWQSKDWVILSVTIESPVHTFMLLAILHITPRQISFLKQVCIYFY